MTTNSYWSQLRPASYRGVRFGVLGGQLRFGRRNAIHEYPFRDTIWVEDLGKSRRMIQMTGFLVGDDVIAQRDALIAACEKSGDGELVHPTLGQRTVALLDVSSSEQWEQGRVFELNFTFVEQGRRQYPESTETTAGAVAVAVDKANTASRAAFAAKGQNLKTLSSINAAVAVAQAWANKAITTARDATSLIRMAGVLQGDIGRMVSLGSGRLSWVSSYFTTGLKTLTNPAASISDLVGRAAQGRQLIGASALSMVASAKKLSPSSTGGFVDEAQGMAAALLDASPTPGAALRTLSTMATVGTSSRVTGSAAVAQGATADLFRRSAAAALATAATQYEPASSEEAKSVRDLVVGVLDAEITTAGDQGEDGVYAAFRALRAAVVQLLNAVGASLPTLMTVTTARPMPSLALAQRLYRDPTRSDELVAKANPIHPAFMPTTFQALSE